MIFQFRKRLNDVIRADDTDAFLLKWLKGNMSRNYKTAYRGVLLQNCICTINRLYLKYFPNTVLQVYLIKLFSTVPVTSVLGG